MESATLVYQNFIIWSENIDAACENAVATMKHQTELHEGSSSILDKIGGLYTIDKVFKELGFDIIQRPDYSIIGLEQRTHEIWSDDNIGVWEAIAPTVRDGSFLIFHTDDDQVIRVKFARREFYIQQGDFIFHGNLAWKD